MLCRKTNEVRYTTVLHTDSSIGYENGRKRDVVVAKCVTLTTIFARIEILIHLIKQSFHYSCVPGLYF